MMELQNLNIQRGDKQLITSLTMQANQGDVVVVLGPNGAGKSTLLLTLAGLHTEFSGGVSILNKPLPDYTHQELSQTITWQGELPPTEFGLTVLQRLELACHGDVSTLEQALNYLELTSLKQRVLGELSSGERQRVEIAAMMVRDNPVWLMDEPTAHLDMRHQVDCLKLIKQQALKGRLIITVLHDLQQAAAVADIVVLLDGQCDGNSGAQVGQAGDLLTAEKLEPIFKVKLQGSGRNLMPSYDIEGDKL